MADDGVEVTYRPGHGDPKEVEWRGHKFKAGETKVLKDAAHVDAAEGNKFFDVKRKDEKTADEAPKDGDKKKSANDYRREFAAKAWGAQSVESLIRAFGEERKLREDNGIDADDLTQLKSDFASRITEMRYREGMGDRQVAELWAKYGMGA